MDDKNYKFSNKNKIEVIVLGIFSIDDEKVEEKYFLKYMVKNQDTGKEEHKESLLQNLIFDNPDLFPVDEISGADTKKWIPLAQEIKLREQQGILDILATDGVGNIYIVECKLYYNKDMKTIRSQMSNYASAFYSDVN